MENEEIEVTFSPGLGHQFAKMIIASAVAFWAGKLTENAYDKVVLARYNKTIQSTEE